MRIRIVTTTALPVPWLAVTIAETGAVVVAIRPDLKEAERDRITREVLTYLAGC